MMTGKKAKLPNLPTGDADVGRQRAPEKGERQFGSHVAARPALRDGPIALLYDHIRRTLKLRPMQSGIIWQQALEND
jgi:hypothetical protein